MNNKKNVILINLRQKIDVPHFDICIKVTTILSRLLLLTIVEIGCSESLLNFIKIYIASFCINRIKSNTKLFTIINHTFIDINIKNKKIRRTFNDFQFYPDICVFKSKKFNSSMAPQTRAMRSRTRSNRVANPTLADFVREIKLKYRYKFFLDLL